MTGVERKGESDVQGDDALASSRETGGVSHPDQTDHGDQHSTTGTTPNSEFVGRVAGADESGAGESGAERRAAAAGHGPNAAPSGGTADHEHG